ncbi:hypothetical protein [Anaerorhabdus furcosa]|uniref:Uncharacterized protein n=1 Tax=Anaerorhabdus furcosa TaxID=118967 RepID=A0A1T4KHX3_9FIRM|nr:hypothetical protein [Anaerorhabdus furcosa]SJZ42029.1 hypothetical protein SAMN02745191_0544 [Anaerorhabdus furcosa]
MEWLNVFGLIMIIIIMIPNIVYGFKNKSVESKYQNKLMEAIEQIGRYGSMFLMIINLPILSYGYLFENGNTMYIVVISILAIFYCLIWIFFFRKETLPRAILLAIIPTLIFVISGVFTQRYLLVLMGIIFGIGHITITYNNNK